MFESCLRNYKSQSFDWLSSFPDNPIKPIKPIMPIKPIKPIKPINPIIPSFHPKKTKSVARILATDIPNS